MNTAEWLRHVLVAFRDRLKTLRAGGGNLRIHHDLSPPCQFVAFEFKDPAWQAIVVTRSRLAPDGQIRIFSPNGWELTKTFDKLLEESLWDDDLRLLGDDIPPSDPEAKLRSVGDQVFESLFHRFKSIPLIPPDRENSSHVEITRWGSDCALWIHHGSWEDVNLEQLLRDSFYEVLPAKAVPVEAEPQTPPATFKGDARMRPYPAYGAFLSPSRTIGRLTGLSFSERVFGGAATPGRLIFRGNVSASGVLVTHSGFIAIETPDRTVATRWLNLIAAGFLQMGIQTNVVREQDVGGVYPPADHDPPGFWGGEYPSARKAGRGGWPDWESHWISDEETLAILHRAEGLANKPYAEEIPLLLEAETHLRAGQPTPSLVFSWAITERAVFRKWEAFLKQRNVGGKRKDKLLDSSQWTMYTIPEAMELAGEFDTDSYGLLRDFRKARNEVFHGERLATHEEATAALRLTERLMLAGDAQVLAEERLTPAGKIVFQGL